MAKRLGISDLRNRIDWAFRKLQPTGPVRVPVDIDALARSIGVTVEWRQMVPEGVAVAGAGGVAIYLQSNFRNVAVTRRQRFTFAHEVCHALFYDSIDHEPKALPGKPSGAVLEKLCQQGAGYLLVPSSALAVLVKHQGRVSAFSAVDALAKHFDVSLDVIIKRLHEEDTTIDNDYGVFVLRGQGGEPSIGASACGIALRALHLMPTPGQSLAEWLNEKVRNAKPGGADTWTKRFTDRDLTIRRRYLSSKTELLELRLETGNPTIGDNRNQSLFT